jgi:agmatine/peptidylarginine deiminase
LLDLIEAQASRPAWKESILDDAAKQLEAWGFRVVRVPLLASKTFHDGWPGVSYINMLAFDRRLFVPILGLGEVEQQIISKLRNDLHGRYDVVPVNARASLLKHGGVHCVFGIIR